jgi:hypothetical protein
MKKFNLRKTWKWNSEQGLWLSRFQPLVQNGSNIWSIWQIKVCYISWLLWLEWSCIVEGGPVKSISGSRIIILPHVRPFMYVIKLLISNIISWNCFVHILAYICTNMFPNLYLLHLSSGIWVMGMFCTSLLMLWNQKYYYIQSTLNIGRSFEHEHKQVGWSCNAPDWRLWHIWFEFQVESDSPDKGFSFPPHISFRQEAR